MSPTLECPCCGDDAAVGEVSDGDALICGCPGWVTVDEGDAYVSIDEGVTCVPCALRERIAELEAELSEAYDDARGLRECIREQSELNEYLRENMDACGEASMATHLDMMAQCDAAEAEARRLRDIMCQSLRIECTAECVAECTAEAVDKRCSQCGGSGSVDIERGFATVPCPKCEEAK